MEVPTVESAPVTASDAIGADSGADISGGPEPSASSGVDLSSLSDDALIDHFTSERADTEEAPAETAEPAVEAKPVEETKPQDTKAEEVSPEETKPTFEAPQPEEVSKAFKSLQKYHPKAYTAMKEAWYAAQAFREQFTFPEVKELRQTFSSVQEAKEARQAHADILAINESLRTDPTPFLQRINEVSPESFARLATSLPAMLYKESPEVYREGFSRPAVDTFHRVIAEANPGDEDVRLAIEILYDRAARLTGRTAPASPLAARPAQSQTDPKVLKELETYRQRDKEREQESANAFDQSVRDEARSSMSSEVMKIIDRTGADLSDEAKQEVVSHVLAKVTESLLADQVLVKKVNYMIHAPGSKRTTEQKQKIVNEILSNARRFVGPMAAERLSWMTDKILRLNQKQIKEQASVQPRRDPGGSVPGAVGAKKTLTKEDHQRMTPDQIIAHYAT